MSCKECSAVLTSHTPYVKCYGCNLYIHLECIGLSKEAASCLTRSKVKNIKMFCSNCEGQESKLDQLIKKLDARDKLVSELSKKLDDLQTSFNARIMQLEKSLQAVPPPFSPLELQESIILEAAERTRRSNNFIITALPESSSEDDLNKAKKIINLTTGTNMNNISAMRLGTRRQDGLRPLKVAVGDPVVVRSVLKNKNKLTNSEFRRIKIFDDQTPAQRDYLGGLRNELKRRIDSGEKDITIKYVKGQPSIVKVTEEKK